MNLSSYHEKGKSKYVKIVIFIANNSFEYNYFSSLNIKLLNKEKKYKYNSILYGNFPIQKVHF
jgi:hypothetical protein